MDAFNDIKVRELIKLKEYSGNVCMMQVELKSFQKGVSKTKEKLPVHLRT